MSKGREPPSDAQILEGRGDLAAAAARHEQEGDLDESLRLVLLLADAEVDAAARVRLLGRAARLASQVPEAPLDLAARYARARLDLLRSSSAVAPPVWELTSLARELEKLDDFEAAAEAYRLAGDRQAEARALAAGGRIEELEGVLDREHEQVRVTRLRSRMFADAAALDGAGQRVAALGVARAFLAAHPADDEARSLLTSLQSKLLRPPAVRLLAGGQETRWVLAAEVFLGRTDADILIASPVLSRRHLRLYRGPDGAPFVEDLATRNGTMLAGARLAAPLPIRGPLTLSLGGEISCLIEPENTGVRVQIGGLSHHLPLATEAALGPWTLRAAGECVRLDVPEGSPPPLLDGDVAAGEGLDLCAGDVLREVRGGPVTVKVIGG
jgi:hypothetical protein